MRPIGLRPTSEQSQLALDRHLSAGHPLDVLTVMLLYNLMELLKME